MVNEVDQRPIDFAFNSTDSFKEWLKPSKPPEEDGALQEFIRIVDFHYDSEGGQVVGLQKARLDLLKKTDDEALIRKAIALSMYARDENLPDITGTLELF
jgi:hypothetical protein